MSEKLVFGDGGKNKKKGREKNNGIRASEEKSRGASSFT